MSGDSVEKGLSAQALHHCDETDHKIQFTEDVWACLDCWWTDSSFVIHTPCGHDWTDQRGHHECRHNMDHRGEHACDCLECRITRDLPPGGPDA